MKICLCSLRDPAPQILERLYETLPPVRRAEVARCRRAALRAAKTVGFHLVYHAARQLRPDLPLADWQIAEGGKPSLLFAELHFSLSHTDVCVAAALDKTRPVGLDIEIVREHPARFAARFFSPEEQALVAASPAPADELTRLWTAKEAVVKESGRGLSIRDLPAISTTGVAGTFFECAGARHALSLSPCDGLPSLEWVDIADLVP